MKRIATVLISLFVFCLSGYCAFTDVNWSARSAGMGGAFTAVADDASSPLINPAGIIQIERSEADFMYTKLFSGLDNVDLALQYASVAHSLGNAGNIGVTWASFDTKDVYNEKIIAYTHAINIAKYKAGLPDVFLGATLKFLSHGYITDQFTVDDPVFKNGNSKWGVTADVGVLAYPCPSAAEDLTMGIALKNITQPDLGLEARDIVPMEMRGGLAYGIPYGNLLNLVKFYDIILALDVDYRLQEWGRPENKLSGGVGAECWMFNRTMALRAGSSSREAAAGISFKFDLARDFSIRFDYAISFPFQLTESSGNQRGSFLVKF